MLLMLVMICFTRNTEGREITCARFCGNPCALMRCSRNTKCVVDYCGDCSASCKPIKKCPDVCPAVFDPVCGSDGKTYSSNCHLGIAICKGSSVRFRHDGPCKKVCNGVCPEIYKPVCGSNGQTYSNTCFLKFAQCKYKNVKFSHNGPCRKKCFGICPAVYRPVCASNGRTFSNLCTFNYAKCKDKSLKLRHKGACSSAYQNCNGICTKIYRPVCGSNGRTYGNMCTFKYAQCKDKSLKLRHNGACSRKMNISRKCGNGICLAVYDPVCASNGKTYSNSCRFKYAQCKDKSLKLISCNKEI